MDASGSDLTYQWKKGGSDIAGATAATLTISNVKVTDAGEYTVVVKNRAGSVTATATLTVSEAPPTIRLAATVSEGAPVLQISVEGTVPASATVLGSQDLVTWTTVGTVTFEGSSATFRDLGTAEIPFRFYKVSVP